MTLIYAVYKSMTFQIVTLLKTMFRSDDQLAYHVAQKKIPYVGLASGERVEPDTNSGIKREKFVFDVFPLAKSVIFYCADIFERL